MSLNAGGGGCQVRAWDRAGSAFRGVVGRSVGVFPVMGWESPAGSLYHHSPAEPPPQPIGEEVTSKDHGRSQQDVEQHLIVAEVVTGN